MPETTPTEPTWILAFTRAVTDVPVHLHPLLDEWRDIDARERRLMFPVETPCLARSDGYFDGRLADFLTHDYRFTSLSAGTRRTYAIEIRLWLDFLGQVMFKEWDEATEDDFGAFRHWRRFSEDNPARVSGATWNKAVAALTVFYRWAVHPNRAYVAASPVPEGVSRETNGGAAARARDHRESRDKWVVPRTYRMWRDVGLLGYSAQVDPGSNEVIAALYDGSSRGRNDERNAAFTDLMFAAALRRRELASLMVEELPESWSEEGYVPGPLRKGGQGRSWTVIDPWSLRGVQSYVRSTREAAIQRALANGRYAEHDRLIVVAAVDVGTAEDITLLGEDGRKWHTRDLDPEARTRLYKRTERGLEPMVTWLSEDGRPMEPRSWNDVFEKANDRVAAEYRRLGRRGRPPRLTPHSLRFTCALFALVAYVRVIDDRLGIDPAQPWVEANYTEAFDFVRDLLGHARVETTKTYYLKPVRDLRRTTMFRESSDVSSVLDLLASRSSLVFDPAERP